MRHELTVAVIASWLGLIVVGMVGLHRYAARPGRDGAAASRWPVESRLRLSPTQPTLLCFAHSRCACTRASLRQLERVVSRHRGAASVLVVVGDQGGDPTASATWELAARVPGARRVVDLGGVEARRFDARTSGTVMLFSPDGALRFRGGITSARGHEGESEGTAALDLALRGMRLEMTRTHVFGCGLQER